MVIERTIRFGTPIHNHRSLIFHFHSVGNKASRFPVGILSWHKILAHEKDPHYLHHMDTWYVRICPRRLCQ